MKQYIYGKNTVIESLKGNKEIYTVYLLHNDNGIISLCNKRKIATKIVDKEYLNKLTKGKNHQGIVAEVPEYKYYSLDEIINTIPSDKQPLLLMLDGLEDPHNLGAILRTCDALNVDGVIIGKNRSVSLNGTVAKVSTGAIDYVKVSQVTNLSRTLDDLKKRGFWVVGCELENSKDYRTVDYNMPIVVVIGSEGFGISRLVKNNCDINVSIPMKGHVNSLNASVATAVILYQVYNSRFPM
ncbi:MAG: 23S rRNA (guanosine(2251)-2'-O)-methyltransferase RlmB [Thomasclavelia sp.]|nr:23S rRNA (guanosine(2251)-2'-O)-methyltransferase RlmB [Thomasclavelia sp.]